jgi:hypothetical protein
MLLHLVAFGLIASNGTVVDARTGDVSTSAGQTAAVHANSAGGSSGSDIPTPAIGWTQPLDPADRAFYAFDWSAWLGTEKVASIERITMSALGASLGVQVDSDPDRTPIIDTLGRKIGLWFKVYDASQADPAFAAAGAKVGIAMLVKTDASPPKYYERTAILTVQQQ